MRQQTTSNDRAAIMRDATTQIDAVVADVLNITRAAATRRRVQRERRLVTVAALALVMFAALISVSAAIVIAQ